MLIAPVICQSCGWPLGDVAKAFNEARNIKIQAILTTTNIRPEQAIISPDFQVDCTDIFEKIQIFNQCCKKSLTCAMDFTQYYR
jgi:hypothetical protein